MRKIIIGLFLLLLAIPFYCQTQQQLNLDKYWSYRQRLKDKFMVVSENVMEYGTNIPAAEIFYNNPANSAVNRISWGDENGNMCQYLSVLATELWILKNNGQNYKQTLTELYYAMLALERLDNFSEANLRYFNLQSNPDFLESTGIINNWQSGDINGFSLRDDVTTDFWNRHKNNNKFDVGLCDGFLINGGNCWFKEENSHDVIEHIMLGLALVSKLVGTESVVSIPCTGIDSHISSYLTNKGIVSSDSHVNFSLWAKDIVKRYINYMQYDADVFCTGTNICTHWILVNPVSGACVSEGAGKDLGVDLISPGIIMAGQAITGENLRKYRSMITDAEFRYGFWQGISKEDKVFNISCIGNISGSDTYRILRTIRDTYYLDGAPSNTTIYEHLPLVWLTLFDSDYQLVDIGDVDYTFDSNQMKGLLNTAPSSGPATNCGIVDWTSKSRCLWPNLLDKSISVNADHYTGDVINTTANAYISFSGLDYMMLHNLYYIAFRKEDIKTINTCDDVSTRTNSQRGGTINAGCSILGTNVTYTAHKQVKLLPGFSASSAGGKAFVANTINRSGEYNGSLYLAPASYNTSAPSMVHKKNVTTDNQSNVNTKDDQLSIDNSDRIEIYPNPCRGKFVISLSYNHFPIDYSIVNSNGLIVKKGQIMSNGQMVGIPFQPKGLYFINLFLKDKTKSKKLVLI